MSSPILNKAAVISAPFTDGTANSNLLLLSMGTTHAAMTIPAGWEGRIVNTQCYGTTGKSGWFLVSELSTAEVDRTIAAAADGAGSPKLGKRILVGESIPMQIPFKTKPGATLYLINESDDATTTAEIWLNSPG